MDFDTARKVAEGKMPADWYITAKNEKELVALVEKVGFAEVVPADLPGGFAFLNLDGAVYFGTGEFLGEDEGKPNPDYHLNRYKTAEEAVGRFLVGGRPVADVVCGLRFAEGEYPPLVFIDSETPPELVRD